MTISKLATFCWIYLYLYLYVYIYINHICIYECIYQLADDDSTLSMWVGSLPGTAPTVAYDDDVIFLGTWTFTMLLEISKNNASAVQNQCLLDSLLTNVANSYSMKRLGHEHGRTKDKRKKRNWDLHDFQFLEKKSVTACIQLHPLRSLRSLHSSAQFLLSPGDQDWRRSAKPDPDPSIWVLNSGPRKPILRTTCLVAQKYTCFCWKSENSTWFNIRFLSSDLECACLL